MLDSLRIAPATNLSIDDICKSVAAIYDEGVTPYEYAEDYRCDNLDLLHSMAAIDSTGQVAGLVVMARRGERGWIADFGVLPSWRGKGLALELLNQTLVAAYKDGIRSIHTDADATNAAVLHTYNRAGFKPRRDLIHLTIPTHILDDIKITDHRIIALDQRDFPEVLPRVKTDAVPPWSREISSLLAETQVQAAYVERKGLIVSAAVWRQSPRPTQWPLCHVLLGANGEPEDLLVLLAQAAIGRPNKLAIPLEPANSRTAAALLAAGAVELGRIHEVHHVV